MKVLITGGAGYIGSHAAKLFVQSGLDCVVVDSLVRGHEGAVKWCPLIQEDLKNEDAIASILRKHKIEAVVHFAAHSLVGESMQNPALYFKNNVMNTVRLLEAMRKENVSYMVFSSTAAIYGNPETVPIPEDHKQLPINPYGETKLFIEKALRWYGEAYGLKWAALRYFNAAGADLDVEIGEEHEMETHLIPLVFQAVLGKRKAIKVFGTDYPTGDGTAVRDYIHIVDLADAHLRALRHLEKGGKNLALNLGTGKGYSVREVIQTVEKVTGKKVPFENADRRVGDPPILVAQADQAAKILNWKPKYSDLETIIKTAWAWHQK